MLRISAAVLAVVTLAACSSGGGHAGKGRSSGTGSSAASAAAKGLTIYHNGYALPPCNIGVAPAPCQRTVSPVEVQFSTPTDVGHGGGYTVDDQGGSITVTEYVDARQLSSCPADDNYPCMADDHHVTDVAGTWEIRD